MIVYPVKQVGKRFLVVFAEENKTRIRGQCERFFAEAEIFGVHAGIYREYFKRMRNNRLYISYIQISFKAIQIIETFPGTNITLTYETL